MLTTTRAERAPISFTLSILAAAFLATYLTIMMTTVVLAAMQTRTAAAIRDTQAEITALESSYYAAIGSLHAADAAALGFVKPTSVQFVIETRVAGLSFAQ